MSEAIWLPATPQLSDVCMVKIRVGPPIDGGGSTQGQRRIIPILDGTVTGLRLNGIVRPGGADFQRLRPDGVTEIQARYMILTDDGATVYVENTGLRHGPPEVMARLLAGESIDPALVYFRSVPKFEVQGAAYSWMERSIFLCAGARFPDEVVLRFFEVN